MYTFRSKMSGRFNFLTLTFVTSTMHLDVRYVQIHAPNKQQI
jgi:hypothetical protein